jgi:hypothetical protein
VSVNYSTLFTKVGSLIGRISSYASIAATTLPGDVQTIATAYGTSATTYGVSGTPINGITNTYAAMQAAVTAWRTGLLPFVQATFTDVDTITSQLKGLAASDVTTVLKAIIQDMADNSQSVKGNTAAVGAVAAQGANVGTGTAIIDLYLDGASVPVSGGFAHLQNNAQLSQLCVPSETMQAVCTQDSYTDHLTAGAEKFSLAGGLKFGQFDFHPEGSGVGPVLTVANGDSTLTLANKGFETFTIANTPDSWTIDQGTAGTHIFSDSSNPYRGTNALKFLGNGSQATIQVSQAAPVSQLVSRRRYLVTCRVKGSAVPAAGNIIVKFTGTGYTAASVTDQQQRIAVAGASGGGYKVNWQGQQTAVINASDVAATIQSKIRALTGLESVVVGTQTGSTPNFTSTITMYGVPGDAPLMTISNNTTGGTVTISKPTAGIQGEQINIPAAGFPTAYGLRYFYLNTPAIIPSDFRLTLAVTGTLDNTVYVDFDDVTFTPVVYFGGINVVLVAGLTNWVRGDRLSWTVTNTQTGKVQDFMRRAYGCQLPNKTDGSESISDTVAS